MRRQARPAFHTPTLAEQLLTVAGYAAVCLLLGLLFALAFIGLLTIVPR